MIRVLRILLASLLVHSFILQPSALADSKGGEIVSQQPKPLYQGRYVQGYRQVPSDAPAGYSNDEVLKAGHNFFGGASIGFAQAIERTFAKFGRPNGYILGEEGSAAIIGGLRYGEGILHTQNAGQYRIYWQGPSVGWDFGADGAKTMMLVYNLKSIEEAYNYFVGVAGSAYAVGGAGVTLMNHGDVMLAPIRVGVGARLGVNIGYLKMTTRPTWNPF